jgi:hypothetical protein
VDIGIPMSDGSWISQEVANTVEMIGEHYPDLEVMWIPRDNRNEDDAAFAIVDRTTRQVMFHVQNEEDMNYSVLDRIRRSDQNRCNPVEDMVKESQRAKRAIAYRDEQQRHEIMEPYLHQLKKDFD